MNANVIQQQQKFFIIWFILKIELKKKKNNQALSVRCPSYISSPCGRYHAIGLNSNLRDIEE